MNKLVLYLGVLFLFGALGCTGMSYQSLYTGRYTHPAPRYAFPTPFATGGGGVVHMNTVPGQIGNGLSKKSGESCSHSVLWLVAFGDSTIEAAKKNGSITKVATVEHEVLGVLGVVYHRHCTVITGE